MGTLQGGDLQAGIVVRSNNYVGIKLLTQSGHILAVHNHSER
jgi:hypothetical protein